MVASIKYSKISVLSFPILWLLTMYLIYIIFNKNILVSASMISILNLLLLLYLTINVSIFKHVVMRIYFLYHALTLITPILFIMILYNYESISNYLYVMDLNDNDLLLTNIIILYFDIFLVISIMFFNNFNFTKFSKPFKYYLFNGKKLPIIIFIIFISYASKLYLVSIGAWFMFLHVDLTKYPNINTIELMSQLDVLVLFYFLYKFKKTKLKYIEQLIMITVIIVSLIFALISTSKTKLFMILIPVILILLNSKRRKLYITILAFSLINMTTLFEFMMYNRIHNEQDILTNISNFQKKDTLKEESKDIREGTVRERFNYQFVVARVIKVYEDFPQNYRYDYLDNLTGLIPRFLWVNKPAVGYDQNQLGREIGLIGKNNFTTSIGVSHVGEAYYELGLVGILIVPIFIGFILVYIVKIFDTKYWIGFLLSFFIAISIINTRSILFIPSLLKLIIIFYFFALVLNDKHTDEKRLKIYWKKHT